MWFSGEMVVVGGLDWIGLDWIGLDDLGGLFQPW